MNAIIIMLATINLTYLPQDAVYTTTQDITNKKASTNSVEITHTSTNTVNLTLAPKSNIKTIHIPYYQLASYRWSMKKIGR